MLNNKGMTLVEVVIGVLLIAIASIMMVQGFGTSARMINDANQIKYGSTNAESGVELEDYSTRTGVENTISNGSVTVKGDQVNGQYLIVKDTASGVRYRVFSPYSIGVSD